MAKPDSLYDFKASLDKEAFSGEEAPFQNEIIVHPDGNLTLIGGETWRLYDFLRRHSQGDLTSFLRNADSTEDVIASCNKQMQIHARLLGFAAAMPYPPLLNGRKIRLTRIA